jgi:hypothetical protein
MSLSPPWLGSSCSTGSTKRGPRAQHTVDYVYIV